MAKCVNCHREVADVCGDGYCRDCHVSITFEDCIKGTWLKKWDSHKRSKKGRDMRGHMRR
jgi:hypothetical protein